MTIWIMTIPQREMTKRELLIYLRHRSKHWQFGRETGRNTGYRHYQVRYESSNDNIATERLYWTGIACELEISNGWSAYELKDGDFYTSDDDDMGKYRFRPLRGFQTQLLRYLESRDDRKITCVVDYAGNRGKTFFARWCDLNGRAVYIEGSGTDENIVRDLYDISGDRRINSIIIDCTRNDRIRKKEFWSSIEKIKNGYLADRRYGYRSKWIKPPSVLVFTNSDPDWEALSKDRWRKIFLKDDGMYTYEDGKKRVTSL